jgi:AraC-like DNA-binding protein
VLLDTPLFRVRSVPLEHHNHADLVSSASRALPIFAIVYKWGFNDLSTFNRAFKNKFGRPPSRVRAEFA